MSVSENLKETVEIVERIKEKNENIIELSTGVKLKIKKDISPSTLIDIVSDLEEKRPEPPTAYVEALDREEINFDDPDYIKRIERWDTLGTRTILDALILLGTEIEFIPEGMETPDGNEWIAVLDVLGKKINRRSKMVRYLGWVKNVAIKTVDDIREVTERVGRRAGVSASDVKLAQNSFPGEKGKR